MSGLLVEEAGIAGLDVAVGRQRLFGLRLILEISDEHARRAELYFARFRNPNVDVRRRRTNRIGVDLAIGLARYVEEGLGLPV